MCVSKAKRVHASDGNIWIYWDLTVHPRLRYYENWTGSQTFVDRPPTTRQHLISVNWASFSIILWTLTNIIRHINLIDKKWSKKFNKDVHHQGLFELKRKMHKQLHPEKYSFFVSYQPNWFSRKPIMNLIICKFFSSQTASVPFLSKLQLKMLLWNKSKSEKLMRILTGLPILWLE